MKTYTAMPHGHARLLHALGWHRTAERMARLAELEDQERRLLDEYNAAIWEHPERVPGIERTLTSVQREIAERGGVSLAERLRRMIRDA